MDKKEILEKLGGIFQLVMGDAPDFAGNENANLVDDLGLNSVGILYLVIAIEESFGIRFDDVGTSDLKTVAQVVDYISAKL